MTGQSVGPYEVVAKLGEGGMGEVYRARDGKLQRDVAIKVLPSAFATDPERLSRFTREAQVLASLNHPHIAHVYGIEEAGDSRALVMELVDGPTLTDRIAEGSIPVNEALRIARQIADALDAAHERGIVHRDLKPANVKLTADGTVKVLDFGLAKALGPGATDATGATAAMTSPAVTQQGVILGTAAYMSPEQARGKPVDKRADIWAFGVLLYEMLTGKVLFAGDTVSDTIAEVLKRDVDLAMLPATTPANIGALVARCLERDPKRRLRDIADALYELERPERPPAAAPASARTIAVVPMVAVALLAAAVATGVAAWTLRRSDPITRQVVRAAYPLPGGLRLTTQRPQVAISPDGRYIAALSGSFGAGSVSIKQIDQLEWRPLPETNYAVGVFFSPDSQFVGYWTNTAIRKVPVAGGAPITIHEPGLLQNNGADGVMWADDGHVYYGDVVSGIYAVPANGGPQRRIVASTGQSPYVPPGSRVVLYARPLSAATGTAPQLRLHPLDGGEDVDLGEGRSPTYLADGTLLFVRDGVLLAARLDLNARRLTTEPVVVNQDLAVIGAAAQYAVSGNGTLVYIPGAFTVAPAATLKRVTRQGGAAPLPGPLRQYSDPRISPDGSRLAVHLTDQQDDVWVGDVSRGALVRMSFGGGEDETPVWSPDGKWIAFAGVCRDSNQRCIFKRPGDGSGNEEALWRGDLHVHVTDWSPDGRTLIVDAANPESRSDVSLLDANPSTAGASALQPLLATPYVEAAARLSPDGRWVAYMSSESGQLEIYVQAFPPTGAKIPVSSGGGIAPVWSRNGRELFFRSNTELMAARVIGGDRISFETPAPLFKDTYLRPQGESHTTYDVFPDGSFVFIESNERTAAAPALVAVFNWFEELKRAKAR